MRLLPAFLALAAALPALAQTFDEWRDPQVNAVNRMDMHTSFFAYESPEAAMADPSRSANYLDMSGLWKFSWVRDADQRPEDFFRTDFNDRGWDDMRVPGIWELNGYGDPQYLNAGYAWSRQFRSNPPEVPVENNHVGSYRRSFSIPADWKDRDIIIHFGSVTSNLYLWVNGRFVGYSEDSKLECEFDITRYVVPGQENLIAFQVFRWCDGSYLEDQDFFRLSGVARDCYMYASARQGVRDVRVYADLVNGYRDGQLEVSLSLKGQADVALDLRDAQGRQVASVPSRRVKDSLSETLSVPGVSAWSAETPYLYTLTATVTDRYGVTEVVPVRVGFRNVSISGSQLLVNGKPILIKGVDRHELDPDGGYAVPRERMEQDIQIMKRFNVNAVRTSHYPDDDYFYRLCDQYGIYMVAEANIESHGMGYGERTLAANPLYHKAHQERDMRNVQRNFNHPAVIVWSLGNEAGYGPAFEASYDWTKAEDRSRPVQYERAELDGKSDIFCPMYYDYANCVRYSEDPSKTKPLIQCEYAHAMGNSEGGFREYWELVRKYPKYQGGFIWDFVDQSIRWKDRNGVMIYAYGGDFNDYDAHDFNFCDNGLISPDRVPNPHMYEVGYYYQNIWTTLKDASRGQIDVYNENFFRDLSDCILSWSLLCDGKVIRTGTVDRLDVAPQQTSTLTLPLGDIPTQGEVLLNVAYTLRDGRGLQEAGETVARDQMRISDYTFTSALPDAAEEIKVAENDRSFIIVSNSSFRAEFSRMTGYLTRYEIQGRGVLSDGAVLSPNFWRAPTDNDFGASLQMRYRKWHDVTPRLSGIDIDRHDGRVVLTASYRMDDVSASLELRYEICSDGTLGVRQSMKADSGAEGVPNLFRFGMQMPLRKDFENITYYGRGPIENYADRKGSTFLGIWSQTVTEQFYPYIRPQENGTKSDVRWWRIADPTGLALEITSDAPFYASALHYSVDSLDEGVMKNHGHSQQVPRASLTNLTLDSHHMGLGCVTSWGQLPRPEYMLPFGDYTFSFTLHPVIHDIRSR